VGHRTKVLSGRLARGEGGSAPSVEPATGEPSSADRDAMRGLRGRPTAEPPPRSARWADRASTSARAEVSARAVAIAENAPRSRSWSISEGGKVRPGTQQVATHLVESELNEAAGMHVAPLRRAAAQRVARRLSFIQAGAVGVSV